ncbi:hypothetical protein [Streptomyces sp. 35G-GA-8]|uniref:hypothetical protein n=1 Tax=Streptomyces sp. 35G-GA-8 TaxID=2939434 RepID=UPI00201F18D9|nr:hypothetical protein [Streptomyces sp. 35G-GA-8]MCL7382198.1 hypothetical protein [Streptomyces sp. 35G-GA-8]
MPYEDQPQPLYQPVPLHHPYGQPTAPLQPHGQPMPLGQHVVPLPQGTVVYPPTTGIDGVVVVPGPGGQPLAYYAAPPAPAPQPIVTPLLVKAALVAFILGVAGIGIYFLAAALVQLVQALVLLGVVLVGGFVLIKLFSVPSSAPGRISVSARGRARVQIHTGRGHNRGRRR